MEGEGLKFSLSKKFKHTVGAKSPHFEKFREKMKLSTPISSMLA